eukprot:5603482-Amphidinium_carterae.1
MRDIDAVLLAEDLCWQLPLPSGRIPTVQDDAVMCDIGVAAYRDDLVVPVIAETGKELLKMLAKVARIVEAAHADRFLKVNFSKGKTEAVVHLVGQDAKPLLQGLGQLGRARSAGGPAILVTDEQLLLIVKDYNHLGRIHAQSGCIKQEVRTNLARAASAFKQRKKVFSSNQFNVPTRLNLYSMYVACHLLKNAPVLTKLPDREYHRLRSSYVLQIRKVLRESSTSQAVSTLNDEALFARYRITTFLALLDRRRLKALPRLLRGDSAPLRAALSAYYGTGSVWTGMFSSLARLQQNQAVTLDMLPCPGEHSIEQWCEFVLVDDDRWNGLVRSHKCADPPITQVKTSSGAHSEDQSLAQCMAELLEEVGLPVFPCELCEFKAKSKAGLAMHCRRKRELENELSLRLASAKCPACGLTAATRNRALDHLRLSKRCRAYAEAHVPMMSREELLRVQAIEQKLDHSWTRTVIPKPGPKPPGYRPPLNGVRATFCDDAHAAAATLLS